MLNQKFYITILFLFIFYGCYNIENEVLSNYNENTISGYFEKRSYFQGDSATLYYNDCGAKDFLKIINDTSTQKKNYIKYFIYDINENIIDSIIIPPKCTTQILEKPWENGFGYDSIKLKLPVLKSGIYLINKKIPFVLKDKINSEIAIIYPTNTVNAYNFAGGKNLYRSILPEDSLNQIENRAYLVSFLRP